MRDILCQVLFRYSEVWTVKEALAAGFGEDV
jgi:hypothetical protein